jgi:DNA replication protein DnaC
MMELQQVRLRIEELGLHQASELIDMRLEAVQHVQSTYLSFLVVLLETELSERKRRNLEVRTKLARLPPRKKLDEFDFSYQPSLDERLIRELATMAFGHRIETCFLDPLGLEKTMALHS